MKEINFGAPAQIAVVQRAKAVWTLLRDDPRYSFQGRAVSLADIGEDASERVIALVRLRGYASCRFVPRDLAADFEDAFGAAGLQALLWEQYRGREQAISRSHAFLNEYQRPDGLSL